MAKRRELWEYIIKYSLVIAMQGLQRCKKVDDSERNVDDCGGIKHQQRKESSQSHRAKDGLEEGGTQDPASLFFKIRIHSSNYIYRIYIYLYIRCRYLLYIHTQNRYSSKEIKLHVQ